MSGHLLHVGEVLGISTPSLLLHLAGQLDQLDPFEACISVNAVKEQQITRSENISTQSHSAKCEKRWFGHN